MFRCGVCGNSSHAGESLERRTAETRERVYPYRRKAQFYFDEDNKRKRKDDPGGVGWEIVREVNVCPRCL